MSKNFPIKDYKGKHWTQLPGGKEKMAAAQKKHWETRRARRKMREMAKNVVVAAKKGKIGVQKGTIRGPYKSRAIGDKETTLSINGWIVTLGKDTVRIEHE